MNYYIDLQNRRNCDIIKLAVFPHQIQEGDIVITVAVCDDDKLFSAAILDKITDIAVKRNIDLDVKLFDSASSLYKAVKDGACFDIIFFDVLIGSENGIEAARGLRELCEGTLFIFLSGYIDFAVQGYEVRAFRYLLKDRIDTELEKTLVEALSELKKKPMYSFSYKNAVYRISLDSILYFESDKRLVLAHTRQKDLRHKIFSKMENSYLT